jgi:alpha-2-macroglobulin-like protein
MLECINAQMTRGYMISGSQSCNITELNSFEVQNSKLYVLSSKSKKMKTSNIFLFIALSLLSLQAFPQKLINNSSTERVYVHTDKPLYFPGETIWFKAYVVAPDNRITELSDYIHVELISPNGEIVKTLKLSLQEASAYGDFLIDKDKPGGMYTLRAYTNWMNNYGEKSYFKRDLIVQKIVKPKLLMKLEFEKEAYGRNSEVIAKFSLKDLKNEALSNTNIAYKLNISGKTQLSGEIQTDGLGKADIRFKLPDTLNTSDVLLNIQVPYNGNTEAISRSVPVIMDNIDLQFLPEGGYMVQEVENTIAFKALNEFGKPADIEFEITDDKGQLIKREESYHDGMGAFKLIPGKNKKYFARIVKPFVSESHYPLPASREAGLLLSLAKNDSSEIIFNIYASQSTWASLMATTADKTCLERELKLRTGWNEFMFPAKGFPVGIVEFTLYDSKKQKQAGRLVFMNKSKGLRISVTTDKKLYKPREKVDMEIKTVDQNGQPIPSNLSIAVVDDKILSFADDKQDNILSFLLMSSYLKGKIEKPNFYFDPEEEKSDKALDLVMLTNGWRSYFHDSLVLLSNAKFKPEQLNTISRTIVDSKNEPIQANVLILEQNSDNKLAKIQTDKTGFFSFKARPNIKYMIIAYTDDGKRLFIKENFVPTEKTKSEIPGKSGKSMNEKQENHEKQIDLENQKNKIDTGDKTIEKSKTGTNTLPGDGPNLNNTVVTMNEEASALEEVVVVGYGTVKKSDVTSAVVSINSNQLWQVANIDNALQGRIAGVQIKDGFPGASGNIRIRGIGSLSSNNDPLFVIDDIPLNRVNSSVVLSTLDPTNIISITVLRDNTATELFGSAATNGVVLITTKSNNQYFQKCLRIKHPKIMATEWVYKNESGVLSNGSQFYVPLYENKQTVKQRNDFRQTIYWNPVVQTDETGKARISFYNSDAITSYRTIVEGISCNGLPGRCEKTHAIERPLSIDVKIPAILSVGDTLEMPVLVSNQTDQEIFANISFHLPEELKLVAIPNDKMLIAPNSGQSQFIRLVPVKETTTTNLSIGVKADGLEDGFKQELTIISPLFPKSLSFSGSTTNKFHFALNDEMAPNTLRADFTLYLDVIGDVMNGTESILGEPHGCFEQVSSTAYPNVLALKYLRESGKLNPKMEKMAMNYIKSGYKQLAAYETKQGGFEWYGGLPPHEVLSAYGIMQFLEMKEIYNGVNEKMIERTINWLMRRKNGKGGFMQNHGKYGFSSAPEQVNNAYIVYALSSPGVQSNIETEYQAAFSEALFSKDNYRLALLALASYNLGKAENYDKIIKLLIEKINWGDLKKLKVENSITWSYESSLQVETSAFIALALMKEKKYNDYTKKCIDFILKNRNHGLFGNTQATSMALKALIEYNKLSKKNILSLDSSVILKIDSKVIERKISQDENGMFKIEGLEKYLGKGEHSVELTFPDKNTSIPYSLDLSWNAILPASSEKCPLTLETQIPQQKVSLGEIVRMNIKVSNKLAHGVPMSIAKIGIPSGLSIQVWQLEELKEKNLFDYYEIMNNHVVFYWRELGPNESKNIELDLKSEVKGNYTAGASSVYLYYSDETKKWLEGSVINVK